MNRRITKNIVTQFRTLLCFAKNKWKIQKWFSVLLIIRRLIVRMNVYDSSLICVGVGLYSAIANMETSRAWYTNTHYKTYSYGFVNSSKFVFISNEKKKIKSAVLFLKNIPFIIVSTTEFQYVFYCICNNQT